MFWVWLYSTHHNPMSIVVLKLSKTHVGDFEDSKNIMFKTVAWRVCVDIKTTKLMVF